MKRIADYIGRLIYTLSTGANRLHLDSDDKMTSTHIADLQIPTQQEKLVSCCNQYTVVIQQVSGSSVQLVGLFDSEDIQ